MPGPERIGQRARRVVLNVVSSGGSQAGIMLVALVTTPVLVSGLGLKRYGLWALAGALVNYFGLLDLGVGSSFVRFLAYHHARDDAARFNSVVRIGLAFYAGLAAVMAPAVMILRGWFLTVLDVPADLRDEASFLIVGVTLIFSLRSVFVVYRAAIAAVERLDVNNRIALLIALPSGLGAVLAVEMGFGLRGLVINALATAALTIVAQAVVAHRLIAMLTLRPFHIDWSVAPELLGYGFRVQATRIAELMYGNVDKLVLGLVAGAAVVGLYDLGMKLSLLAAALPTLLLPAVAPTSAVLEARGNRVGLESLHARGTKYVALVLAPATAFIVVAASPLLALWIGSRDLDLAVLTARLLALGSAPLLALGVSRLVARGIGMPEMEMRASLVSAGVNIAASLALVRVFGAVGAPLGTACAGVLGSIVFLRAFRRKVAGRFDLDPIRPLVVPTVAAAFAGVSGFAGLALARMWSLPEGRPGAVIELTLAAVPFLCVYLAGVFRTSLLDDYDHRVARETWAIARTALGRPGQR
jgi:O-antigen/teichoic acid export membrane protein